MVQVTEDFQNLAMQPGRTVYCKIIAGSYTYYDDSIIEFDFDDIAHPDYFTIGLTCANRFAFSVRYREDLDVGAEVKPFISFDGEEWCPLGVFFISRRYVRGSYASIICYDRMYSLDGEYSSSLAAPATTSALLREICSNYGITCSNFGGDYAVSEIPSGCTVKEMLGYIASMNCGNIKFDRNGALSLRPFAAAGYEFFLKKKNCMDIEKNMNYSQTRRVVVDTGDGVLEAGSGGELLTIEIFNPLMTQERLNLIRNKLTQVCFYGAEIEMQGLPFLEAGDFVNYVDGSDIIEFALSELNYHYDGTLTAKLHSRNRSYSDPMVHKNELEAALAEIRTALGNVYETRTNEAAIALSTAESEAAAFSFETKKSNAFAQIDVNFTVDGGGSNTLYAAVYVNGEKKRESVHTVNGSARELLHLYYLADNLPKGKNAVKITLRTASGQMAIQKGQLVATLVAKGLAGGANNIRDRQVIFDDIPIMRLKARVYKIVNIACELQTEIKEAT